MNGRAVVTGASSGIGEAFALALADRGMPVLLSGRDRTRLEAVVDRIRANGGLAEVDLRDLSVASDRQALADRVAAMDDLGILVHAAGFGVTGAVGAADPARLEAMAGVHVLSTLALCSAAAPVLRRRGSGAVVVVSSIAGWLTGSGSATYCATKAFQTSFARSLARELAPHGVRAMALCPGYTRSRFHDTPEYAGWDRASVPAFLWSDPDAVVRRALSDLQRGREVSVPGVWNRFLVAVAGSDLLSPLRERIRRRRMAAVGPAARD